MQNRGKAEVRQLLTDAVRKARTQQKMTQSQLSRRCYFKKDGLPTCAEFERHPSKMTQEVFCRAACELDLKIDKVLKLDLSSKKTLKAVIADMDKNEAGLAAALGKAEAIPDEKVAPVYAALKVLSEI